MRVITNILVAAFVLSALAVLGLWLMHYGENPKSHFATYPTLAASELIDKGLQPPLLLALALEDNLWLHGL